MSTRRKYKNCGFTLLEMMIAISILVVVSGFALTSSMDELHRDSLADTETALVNTLAAAREQAMNSICLDQPCVSTAHGVHFTNSEYVLFEGQAFDPNDSDNEQTNLSSGMSIAGPTDIIFSPLSGNISTTPTNSWTIVLKDASRHVATTTLDANGKINYEL